MQKLNHDNFDVLNELILIHQEAINFGFSWPNMRMLIAQIISECKEIEQAHKNNESNHRIQEEIGDLLHAVISLCIFHGFDVKQTILKNNNKFNGRLKALKIISKNQGFSNLQQQPIKLLINLWEQAKKHYKSEVLRYNNDK